MGVVAIWIEMETMKESAAPFLAMGLSIVNVFIFFWAFKESMIQRHLIQININEKHINGQVYLLHQKSIQ